MNVRLIVGYDPIQFPYLQRCRITFVSDTNSELYFFVFGFFHV